jgi:hypothetical protein
MHMYMVYVWFGFQNVSECLDTTIVSAFTRIRKARRVVLLPEQLLVLQN